MEFFFIEDTITKEALSGLPCAIAKQHYVYIKYFNRLMYSFTDMKVKKHFCMYCLQCFYSNDDLENHKSNCIVINGVQAIQLPKT